MNPKWTKQGKEVSMSKIQIDKLDIGKTSKTSKKVMDIKKDDYKKIVSFL